MATSRYLNSLGVNKSLCQHLRSVFDDLTLGRGASNCRCHLVDTLYACHAVQTLTWYRGLDHCLQARSLRVAKHPPSPDLRLSNVITCLGCAAEPSRENLRKFCAIWSKKVAQAAIWLCRKPSVADHVTVNEESLQSWPEESSQRSFGDAYDEPGLSDNREDMQWTRGNCSKAIAMSVRKRSGPLMSRCNPGLSLPGVFTRS